MDRESSHIDDVRYDHLTATLEVDFKGGGRYRYSGVPPVAYQAFLDAPSLGAFHAKWIRGKYPHERVGDAPA